jgi:hypothetical protein
MLSVCVVWSGTWPVYRLYRRIFRLVVTWHQMTGTIHATSHFVYNEKRGKMVALLALPALPALPFLGFVCNEHEFPHTSGLV